VSGQFYFILVAWGVWLILVYIWWYRESGTF